MKAFKATHKHSQPARDGRELPCQRSHFSRGGGMGRHHGTRPQKSQTTKATSALVVRWMKMSLSHAHDDPRARNPAHEPLPGGANQRLRSVPWSQRGARWGGSGRVCTRLGCTWIICTNIRPCARLKITSPPAVGRLGRARGGPTCARVRAKGRGARGRGLVGSAKAGSR